MNPEDLTAEQRRYLEEMIRAHVHATPSNPPGPLQRSPGSEASYWREPPFHHPVPTWKDILAVLDVRGYDSHRWMQQFRNDLAQAFIEMSSRLLDDMDVDPIHEYHTDAQRHALVEILTGTVMSVISQRYEDIGGGTMQRSEIDWSMVLTNSNLKALFEGDTDGSKEAEADNS